MQTNDGHLPKTIVYSESLKELIDWINRYQCDCILHTYPTDPFFLMSQEETSQLGGSVGIWGDVGPSGENQVSKESHKSSDDQDSWETEDSSDDQKSTEAGDSSEKKISSKTEERKDIRSIYTSDQLTVTIVFQMPKDITSKLPIDIFQRTPNQNGGYLQLVNCQPLDLYDVVYMYGIYKLPGFDVAYNGLKNMKSKLTELEFSKFKYESSYLEPIFDTDLVTFEPYRGMKDCISLVERERILDKGICKVILTLREIDIANNLEHLKVILFPMCNIRDQSMILKYPIIFDP